MKLVALRPSDGEVVGDVAISQDVPNASANYGYSETSAPICANGRVVVGAAGSEYGIRGFVMAYTTDLKPAWPSPFWTSRPRGSRGGATRASSAAARSGRPSRSTRRRTRSTSAPARRRRSTSRRCGPAPNPRTDSLIAVDLRTGRMKWWQQLIAGNEWAYDVSQPPLVYNGKVGGRTRRIVSVGDDGGRLVRVRRADGRAVPRAGQGDRPRRAPAAAPGQPVTVFPSSLGGLNYSPASYDPATNHVFNAAAETAAVLIQQKLTPTQKRRKLLLGDVFLGLENGDFGASAPGLAGPRVDQRDRRRRPAGASGSSGRPSPSAAA